MSGRHAEVARLTGITKTFGSGAAAVHAVSAADLVIRRGEIVALIGTSGSGKSTLLTLLIGWERPDTGEIVVQTVDEASTDPASLGWDTLAVLPQALGLLDDLSMWNNVLLPARARGRRDEYVPRARELVDCLGVGHLADRYPGEMSLGEQQRACVARTLVLSPQIVVADEPTAHQDHGFVEVIVDVLRAEAAQGTSILIATHNAALTTAADRVLRMTDGHLAADTTDPA